MLSKNSIDDIFISLLKKLKDAPDIEARGMETKELINMQFQLNNPLNCLMYGEDISYYKYIINEFFVYLSGTHSSKDFEKLSKFWLKCADEKGIINSNYGKIIFHDMTMEGISQFEWCAKNLKSDMYSRQAVINFNSIEHKYSGNNDIVCTMFLQFMIRDDSLDMYVFMRSNDIIYGLRYDAAFFCFIQILMWITLKNKYKCLKLGSYFHHAGSLHIYKKHYFYFNELKCNI